MEMRTKKPVNNKYYQRTEKGGYNLAIKGKPTDSSCDVLSNCCGYANGRYAEIIGKDKIEYQLVCNAEKFIEKAKKYNLEISDVPSLGGIMVWEGIGSLAGHVAIVERIDSKNQIYTSESNYGGVAFCNVTRKNDNGRWGLSSKYKFLGCIINPAIGRVIAEDEKVEQGNYKTLFDLYVRTGAGTNHSVKLVKDLTPDGKKNATSQNPFAYAVYKKGTIFTALEIIVNNRGTWARTPSGYVCIKGVNGKEYCEKC